MPGTDYYSAPKAPASFSTAPMKPQSTGWPVSPRDELNLVSPISSIEEIHLSPFLQSSRNNSGNPEEKLDWTTDGTANALWAKLSAPEASGSYLDGIFMDYRCDLVASIIRPTHHQHGRSNAS